MKLLRNQKGVVAILTVTLLTLVLVISLLSIYVYVINRSRSMARIKEAYKLIDIMSEAAKNVHSAWDNAAATATFDANSCCAITAPAPCLATSIATYGSHACVDVTGAVACGPATKGCVQDIAFTSSNAAFTAPFSCPGGAACCAVCTNASMCFDNPDNVNLPYCFFGLTSNNVVQYKMETPDQWLKPTLVEKFVVKLDRFFEGEKLKLNAPTTEVALHAPSIWNWLLAEKQALAIAAAHPTGPCCGALPPESLDAFPPAPAPLPAYSVPCTYTNGAQFGCMNCGPTTLRQCSLIYACPSTFLACIGWAGTAATALFGQEFALMPPGVCVDGAGNPITNPAICY